MRGLKKILPLAIALLVAAYLYFVDNPSSRLYEQADKDAGQQAPAFFITDFVSDEFDASGQLRQRLSGERAEHYQPTGKTSNKDYTLIQAPRAEIFQQQGQPWQLSARLANADAQGDRIELTGDVRLWQEHPQRGRTELRTEKLIYFNKQARAETDAPVTIHSPNGNTTAIGLSADLRAETLTLQQRVRGTHDPH